MTGSVFAHDGEMELVRNEITGKEVRLKTTASTELHDRFTATVDSGQGTIKTISDLTGLTP